MTVAAAAFASEATPAGAAATNGAATANSGAAANGPAGSAFRDLPGLKVQTVNLHSEFQAKLAQVTTGKRAGIMPMLGKAGTTAATQSAQSTQSTTSTTSTQSMTSTQSTQSTKSATPASTQSTATCKEPNCNMTYHGGPVQHSPHVILDFWGPDWGTDATENGAEEYLALFFYGLGQTKYEDWSTIASQYGDKTGHPVFGKSVMGGINFYTDTSTPPATVTPKDLATEAELIAKAAKVTDFGDTQVIVASQSGTCFSDGFGGNCGNQQATGYCGWHSATTDSEHLPFVNLPYNLDAGFGCGQDFVNPDTGIYDGFSMTAGHEYMETVTDPQISAWYDASDTIDGGGEIGDKCIYGGQEWGSNDPFGNLVLPTPPQLGPVQYFDYAVQSLWSNVTQSCVMQGKLPFTVAGFGNPKITLGKPFSVYIIATTTPKAPLTFTAKGLPAGITVNAAGHVSGTPNVTAGTFKSTITVAYYDGSQSFTTTWSLSSAPGPVKGYKSKCADDYAGHTTNGTKIDLWTCVGGTRQKITFAANGELQVAGKCIQGGTTAVLEPCKALTSQTWTRQANGEYVLKSKGTCLTDPANSTANGRQLTLAACKNTANQHWSLP